MSDLLINDNGRLVRQDIISQTQGYNTSERYIPIPTQSVLDIIKEVEPDYKIVGFNNANVRKADKQSFQKHALMINLKDELIAEVAKPNLIIFNSSDRSMALKIYIGYISMACSNQCVAGTNIMEPISIRHTDKNWKHTIYSLMNEYESYKEKLESNIINMKEKYVSYGDQGMFIEEAVNTIINPNIEGEILDPLQFNNANRKEDTGKTLYKLMQRFQENMVKGGIKRIIEKTDDNNKLFTSISNTHVIKDNKKLIKMNQDLHNLATNML